MAAARQSFGLFSRNFSLLSRSAVRPLRGDVANGPGQNMPFQTKNKFRLVVTMFGAASFAFSLPFVMVVYQMRKNST
uniref:Cytochrome c oxidase subunit 7C, mitochondrial n=1 Tax=Amphimedon queenslandica TaxID=400682 RepID=A0A1X7V6X9_AMPQE